MEAFIAEHLNDPHPEDLLLSAARYPGVSVAEAVTQIQALQKLRHKAPAWYNTALRFPPRLSIEQASSGVTAAFKASLIQGKTMADLTGGLGIDVHAFSQHFEKVVYVDQNPQLVTLARHNFAVLGADNVEVWEGEAEAFLEKITRHFDLIYLDPARRDAGGGRVFRLHDCTPDVLNLRTKLLACADKVLVKTAPMLDIALAMRQLEFVQKVWVVSVDDEVKELLFLLEDKPAFPENIPIETVNLGKTPFHFVFSKKEEQEAAAEMSEPLTCLYEPPATIFKAGAFNTFAQRYGLKKLHTHTHLYTSETLNPEVPGRVFHIRTVTKYDKKAVAAVVAGAQANVAVRNFPDTAEMVRKKLGLKDGGEVYLFAVTTGEGKKIIIGEK
ncbi:MAG: RsmD family RNA methyltransferase [Saprospiraceae bacterium]|nr:RsmD family RNA methyltransferase [Saprospiraceae bacterium]